MPIPVILANMVMTLLWIRIKEIKLAKKKKGQLGGTAACMVGELQFMKYESFLFSF